MKGCELWAKSNMSEVLSFKMCSCFARWRLLFFRFWCLCLFPARPLGPSCVQTGNCPCCSDDSHHLPERILQQLVWKCSRWFCDHGIAGSWYQWDPVGGWSLGGIVWHEMDDNASRDLDFASNLDSCSVFAVKACMWSQHVCNYRHQRRFASNQPVLLDVSGTK